MPMPWAAAHVKNNINCSLVNLFGCTIAKITELVQFRYLAQPSRT